MPSRSLVIFLSPSLPWETARPSGKSPFEAGFARPVHSRTYASPRALLLVSQGSLPAARARFAGRDFHPLDDSTEFQCFIMLLLSVLPFLVAPHVGTNPRPAALTLRTRTPTSGRAECADPRRIPVRRSAQPSTSHCESSGMFSFVKHADALEANCRSPTWMASSTRERCRRWSVAAAAAGPIRQSPFTRRRCRDRWDTPLHASAFSETPLRAVRRSRPARRSRDE